MEKPKTRQEKFIENTAFSGQAYGLNYKAWIEKEGES
jgi:hypothetical protein